MKQQQRTRDTLATELARFEDHADGMRELVERAQERREELRGGDPVELARHDADLADMRQGLAEVLLTVSRRRRDAGDHEGALAAAHEYAHQAHLAATLRTRQARRVS